LHFGMESVPGVKLTVEDLEGSGRFEALSRILDLNECRGLLGEPLRTQDEVGVLVEAEAEAAAARKIQRDAEKARQAEIDMAQNIANWAGPDALGPGRRRKTRRVGDSFVVA
jgi:hypothetical protein